LLLIIIPLATRLRVFYRVHLAFVENVPVLKVVFRTLVVRVRPLTFSDDLLDLLCSNGLLLVFGVEAGFFFHHLDDLFVLDQVFVLVVDLVQARHFLAFLSVELVRLFE
jgi:hypothetical protein